MRTESWRTVAILSAAQALAASAGPFVMLAGGIIGESLAPSPMLATLPITALVVGLAAGAVPVALLIRRVGRRAGFMLGAGASAAGMPYVVIEPVPAMFARRLLLTLTAVTEPTAWKSPSSFFWKPARK